MAEAEPPDKDFCFFLPLIVKYKAKGKFKPLVKDQYCTLYHHLSKELTLIQREVPSIKDFTFADPHEIKIVFKIKKNEKDLSEFYSFVGKTGDGRENDLERVLRQYLVKTKINLDLKLSLYTDLKIHVNMDKKEYGKIQKNLKTGAKEVSRETQPSETKNEYAKLYLPLTVKYKDTDTFNHLSKDRYKDLCDFLLRDMAVLQERMHSRIPGTSCVNVGSVSMAESGNLLVEFDFPKSAVILSQFYNCAQEYDDGRENILEREIRYFLMQSSILQDLGPLTEIMLSIFITKEEFKKKQIECDDIDDAYRLNPANTAEHVAPTKTDDLDRQTPSVRETVSKYEHASSIIAKYAWPQVSQPKQQWETFSEDSPQQATHDRTQECNDQDDVMVRSITKTFIVYLPVPSNVTILSVKMRSRSMMLDGKEMIRHANRKDMFRVTVNIPIRDLGKEYLYLATFHKPSLLVFSSTSEEKSYTNTIKDNLIQRDIFSGFDMSSYVEHLVDIFYSDGCDLENMNSCIKEIDDLLWKITCDFPEFKDIFRRLKQRTERCISKKALVLTCVVTGQLLYDIQLVKKMEHVDSKMARTMLWALQDFKLRHLNSSCHSYMYQICYTLSEIFLGKNFCILSLIDVSYPFLDEEHFQELISNEVRQKGNFQLVAGNEYDFMSAANKICTAMYKLCLNDTAESQPKGLLRRLFLHLPVRITLHVTSGLLLSNTTSASTESELQQDISKMVMGSLNAEILRCVKWKNVDSLFELWQHVQLSGYPYSVHLLDIFEKAILDFIGLRVHDYERLATTVLRFSDDKILFSREPSIHALLTNLAESTVKPVLGIFLDLVRRNRYESFFSEKMCHKWLNNTIRTGGGESDVSQMYFALNCLLSVNSVMNSSGLKTSLLQNVYKRLEKQRLLDVLKQMPKMERMFKESPDTEEIFQQHVSTLMSKMPSRHKPVELLESVCTNGVLRINSRITARIVTLILKELTRVDPLVDDLVLFREMVVNFNFWKIVFQGIGKTIDVVKHDISYKRAELCLENVRHRFTDHNIQWSFLNGFRERQKQDAIDLLRIQSKHPFDITKHWIDIRKSFQDTVYKIEVTHEVLVCLIESVPGVKLEMLSIDKELQSYKDEVLSKLSERDLIRDCAGVAQKILVEITPMCQKIQGIIKSKVFWNVSLPQIVDEYELSLSSVVTENEAREDDILMSIANLFSESDTHFSQENMPSGESMNMYFDFQKMTNFIGIVCKTGVEHYNKEWKGINEEPKFPLEKYGRMFDGARCEIEIELFEQFQCLRLKEVTKQTLLRLQKLREMESKVGTLKQVLASLNIGISDDKEFYDAVTSFKNFLSGVSSSYTFYEASEALKTIHEIADPLSDDTIAVLQAIGDSSKLIAFLQSIIDEDIRNLIDAVEDISEQHVQEMTVSSLIEIKRFLYPILKRDFNRKAQSVFQIIHGQTIAQGKSANSIPIKIDDCMSNLHNLKSLYNNVANRSEQTKETVENIVKIGRFDFILDEDKCECPFRASYSFRKNKTSHSRVVLFDLRSRALLLMNKHESADGLKGHEMQTFIQCIDSCAEISDLVMLLHSTGHIGYKTYKVTKDASSLNTLKGVLQHEYERWVKHLEEIREAYYLVNFLQGSQMFILHNYLEFDISHSDCFNLQVDVDTLLKFIHPEISATHLKTVYQEERLGEIELNEQSFILHIGKVLHKCYDSLGLFERRLKADISKTKKITDVVQVGKLFVAHLDDSSLLVVKTILTLFYNTVNRLPEPNQLLFCSGQTTWSEIDLLIRRCLGSYTYFGRQVLFCIANVEALPNELQFKLVGALRNLNSGQPYMFAVVCRGSKNHPFVDELNEFVCNVRPLSDKVVDQIFHNECHGVTAITSKVAGLGKTTHIGKMAFSLNHSLKAVHISGTFDKATTVGRLKALEIVETDMLHIDVGMLGNCLEFDTFLFEFILLRFVTTGRKSVYLPTSYVVIEIANSLQDSLRISLQTAVSFKRVNLKWQDFEDYIVSEELHSPVQVVCHFLQELELGNLDAKDIQFNGVNCVSALSPTKCRLLLRNHFPQTANMSFCLVNIFLNVLSDQFKKMSNSSFFKTSRIRDMIGNKTKPIIRSSLAKALVEVSKEFSTRSVDTYRATQLSTLKGSLNDGNMSRDKGFAAQAAERTAGMIQWEDSNHLMYVFHNQNIQTISPVYRDKHKVPDHIKSLFESQMKKELQDYRKMSQLEFQTILQKISRSNPLMLKESILSDLSKEYALTPDNLLKMILIVLRIKANIPVLIMGETGCGKTSLIRYLARICEVEFDVLNIHAGVEEQSITEKISSCNLKALNNLEKEHWLFFDEINTSEYVGLISHMICHKEFSGLRLAPNLVLMGACNPYRLRSASAVSTAGLKGKVLTDELSRLVYRVLPLPEMLVDYVWDFGSLDKKDETLYISRMTECVFDKQVKYHNLFTDLLSKSQIFVRETEGSTCSVSLRDVKRCKTLVTWFMDILEKKFTSTSTRKYIRMNKEETAIVLSLAHCYHCRISDMEGRKAYRQTMANVFKDHGYGFSETDIGSVIKYEQEDILNRMELPPGTAKNTALRENVFVLLVCILNKIPIFIVGKPGCSKSLSMQIIRSNLRGEDSKDEFFKQLPHLYCVSFQGSESSTSDGIIKVFEKAEKYQESNQLDAVMSVVILDEIGLAEISRFNPLKVLHNLLEPDGRDRPNVAVVGISNWSLDASKMNRAIHLSRPDMDENELFETGMSIFDSFVVTEKPKTNNALLDTLSKTKALPQLRVEDFKNDLENIAKSYFKYVKVQTFSNFHGLRDFYSLVKFFAKEMSSSTNSSKEEKRLSILKGLERNFGGLPAERSTLMSIFNFTETDQPSSVIGLIRNNVDDEMARHLMLITTGESVIGILNQTLDEIGRENREIIFGSQFEEDLTDDYNYRILNRIIICMEQGAVLILKDLESIYGSLYDMLNQNYTVIGKKKNCRVALGPYSNPICHVANSFRCIVIVDDSKLAYSDPPFLNRFEKQHLQFSDIINPRQNCMIDKIEGWVRNMCILDRFDETDAFPIYGDDMVSSLILKHFREDATFGDLDEACILDKCKHDLLWIIKPEAMIRLRKIESEDLQLEYDHLIETYFSLPIHNGIEGLIESQLDENSMAQMQDKKLMTVVFTNSNIHTKVLQNISRWSVQVEKLGSFKSEKQLSLRMHTFWHESDADLLIVHCSAIDDEKHIMLAKSVIERYRQEYVSSQIYDKAKHVYFVIHMDRNKGRSNILSQINFLSSWELVTLDSLDQPETLLSEMCKLSLHNALLAKRPLNDYIKEQLFWAFTRIRYSESGRNVASITDVMLQVQSSDDVLHLFDELVYSWLERNFSDINDTEWQIRVACDSQALQTSSSFIEALENYVSKIICLPLAKYIYKMESECILNTFFVGDIYSEERRALLTKLIADQQNFSILNIPEETGPESYICSSIDLTLKMPFSKSIFTVVETTRDEFMLSVKMLKERCGIEPDDSLPEEILLELEKKQDLVICHQIPLILQLRYSTALEDYFEDFCNIVSFTICPRMPAIQRVKFTRWVLSDYLQLYGKDFTEGVVSIHIAFWINCDLFTSQLRLLEMCSNLLTPGDLFKLKISEISTNSLNNGPHDATSVLMQDTLVDEVDDMNSVSVSTRDNEFGVIDSEQNLNETDVRNSTYTAFDDRALPQIELGSMHNSEMSETDGKSISSEINTVTEELGLLNTHFPHIEPQAMASFAETNDVVDHSPENKNADNKSEGGEPIGFETDAVTSLDNPFEPNAPAENVDMYSISDDTALEKTNETYMVSCTTGIQSEITPSNDDLIASNPIPNTDFESDKPTGGKDILVEIVCMKMLPTRDTLQQYANLKVWLMQVNSALTLVRKIDPSSVCRHYLRVCSDVVSALIVPYGLETTIIEHLASCIQKDSQLDSDSVFDALFEIIKMPIHLSASVRQRILSEYLLRCLISDPESQALSRFMKLVFDLPEKNVSVFKEVIKFALDFETCEEDTIYLRILEHGLDELSTSTSTDGYTSDMESEDEHGIERPFIKDLDTLLKCIGGKNMTNECPFLILVIDIFEELFAEYVDHSNGEILNILVRSQKIIILGNFNLQFVLATSFFKASVKYFLNAIDSTNTKVNEYINAIFGCKSEYPIREYVWKVLAHEKIASKFVLDLKRLREVLPNVEDMPRLDQYTNYCLDSCPVVIFIEKRPDYAFWDSHFMNEGDLKSIVDMASKDSDCLFYLFGYVERQFYIPRSHSLLDDKTKSHANEVAKLINACDLKEHSIHLLQCLLGKEDFKIPNFNHSEQSSQIDCLLNGFLMSTYCLIFANTCGSKSASFFQSCLLRPNELDSRFVPGCTDGQDPIHQGRSCQSNEVWFAICSCQHRLALFCDHEQTVCPICKSYVKHWDIKEHEIEEIVCKPGLSLSPASKKLTYCVRRLSPISCHIISLLIKGCMLGFLALGRGEPDKLKHMFAVGTDDISCELWKDVEEHWHVIGTLLGVGERTVGIYLHTVLYHARELLFITCPDMTSSKDRSEWELSFESIVQDVTQNRFCRSQAMIRHHHEICGVASELEDMLLEMDEGKTNVGATCFRMKNQASFENFLNSLFPVQERYPIINLILTRKLDLQLSIHILNIVQWHMAVVAITNYTMRKHECLILSVSEFIHQLGDKHKSEILRKRFGELRKSWSKLVELLKETQFSSVLTRLHADLKMKDCIIHDLDSIQYKVLEFLVGRHNAFVDDVLSVASRCESAQFLMRSENTAAFPCVGVTDITSLHLLRAPDDSLDWNDLLGDKAHSDTTYGHGQMIWYDFHSVESQFTDQILVGRAFILLGTLPNIIFTDELYKNYVSLSKDIKAKVKQIHLTREMKANLIEKQKNEIRIIRELLMQIGMILTLINKTGGDPDKCLIDYIEEMKNTLTKRFSHDMLPGPSNAVKLCHVVALYELLEELNADSIIEALEDQYRRDLGMDLFTHFENLVKDNPRLGTFILSACKRFINRCLSLREADESRPLLDYLSDDSFWPEDVKSGNEVRYGDRSEYVGNIIPKDVMVNNIYCLVDLISSTLESQQVERMELSKMATSWQSSQKGKPVVKEVKKQKALVKKRKNIR